MERAPLIKEDDEYGVTCGQFGGEPWLAGGDESRPPCENRLLHRQVGNSSVSMMDRQSMLLIPLEVAFDMANKESVHQYLTCKTREEMEDDYSYFSQRPHKVEDLHRDLKSSEYWDDSRDKPKIDLFFDDLWTFKNNNDISRPLTLGTLRSREYKGLLDAGGRDDRFLARPLHLARKPANWQRPCVEEIVRVDKLTVLDMLTGLKRLESTNPSIAIDRPTVESVDSRGLGQYNYGEGIFLKISPDWLRVEAEKRKKELGDVANMNHSIGIGKLPTALKMQIQCLEVNGEARNAFTVLHTFSHLLLKQLCMESGYSLSSVAERLFFETNDDGQPEKAGILLYTSGPSSDGTLGGLAGQAGIRRMNAIVKQALARRGECSNDPVCGEHTPTHEEPNGAACHTCVILPETACEARNHLLDRNWG